MRWPPRQTPSERAGGLVRLYGLLYPQGKHAIAIDEAYHEQRSSGVAYVHVWINRGACPHAVESTAALVQAQQLDEQLLSTETERTAPANERRATLARAACEWPVRSSYAMAIIRFVNAVADEQQTGLYAQSIFSIAERIGLPLWYVELRHAATHEEMPSLDVLRQASVAALSWLQARFWGPSIVRLQPADSRSDVEDATEGDAFQQLLSEHADLIRGHLRDYKRLAKQMARDASLRGPKANELKRLQSQALQAASRAAKILARETHTAGGTLDSAPGIGGYEAEFLLAEVLVEPGFLVPEADRKRTRPKKAVALWPLSTESLKTWMPLLALFNESLYGFSKALLETLLDRSQAPQEADAEQSDSYVQILASWLYNLHNSGAFVLSRSVRLGRTRGSKTGSDDDKQTEQRTVSADAQYRLDQSMRLARACLARPTPISLNIVKQLCRDEPALAERIEPLLELALPFDAQSKKRTAMSTNTEPTAGTAATAHAPEDMNDMERAVLAMEAQLASLSKREEGGTVSDTTSNKREAHVADDEASRKRQKKQRDEERLVKGKAVCAQLPGWRLADSATFQATPLGCVGEGTLPNLVLHGTTTQRAQ